jgi:hypothetical protein
MANLIVDASTQAIAVYHNRIRLFGIKQTDHALCDLNRIQAA